MKALIAFVVASFLARDAAAGCFKQQLRLRIVAEEVPCHTSGAAVTACADSAGTSVFSQGPNTQGRTQWCDEGAAVVAEVTGSVVSATQTCVGTSGAAVRVIANRLVMKLTATETVIVSDETSSSGSQSLALSSSTLVNGSTAYSKATSLRGVAGQEIDWVCYSIADIFAPNGTR